MSGDAHLRQNIVNSLTFYCKIDMCNNQFFSTPLLVAAVLAAAAAVYK